MPTILYADNEPLLTVPDDEKNMLIACEYCGELIDLKQYTRCPNCAASLADNKEYIRHYKKKDNVEYFELWEDETKHANGHCNNFKISYSAKNAYGMEQKRHATIKVPLDEIR